MAIIVETALNLDMVVLVKQRVGSRPFRIFTNLVTACDWLESYADSYRDIGPHDTFAPGGRPRPRHLRTN